MDIYVMSCGRLAGQMAIFHGKSFSVGTWDYFWVRFIETREITAVLHTASKRFSVGMQLNVYGFDSTLVW